MRSCQVPLAVVVLAVCAGHASAAAADFDIWKCPLANAATSKMGQDVSSEYHCISTDFIKGSIAGMGYFEGVKSNFSAGSNYVVSWFNMSLALGNPDRTQVKWICIYIHIYYIYIQMCRNSTFCLVAIFEVESKELDLELDV